MYIYGTFQVRKSWDVPKMNFLLQTYQPAIAPGH